MRVIGQGASPIGHAGGLGGVSYKPGDIELLKKPVEATNWLPVDGREIDAASYPRLYQTLDFNPDFYTSNLDSVNMPPNGSTAFGGCMAVSDDNTILYVPGYDCRKLALSSTTLADYWCEARARNAGMYLGAVARRPG